MPKTDATKEKDVAYDLARNVATINYKDLPPEVVAATKMSILDTLGVILAASGTVPGIAEIVELVRETGGREEGTIVGFGGRVPAWMAAFANAAMGHAMDYDDLHHGAMVHPSSPTVTAAFAVAERLGSVKGSDFISAVALGNDVACRLGMSVPLKGTWHPTTVFGVFGAATAAGKLLGLDEEKMVDALGIAFCHAAGTMELREGVGSNLGGLRDAFPAKGGVLSALMVHKGIGGIKNTFEGKAGLFSVYFNGEYDRTTITSKLGKRFEGASVGFKPWPSCGTSHIYVDATLQIVNEHNIAPDDVEEITATVGDWAQKLFVPLEGRRRPATTLDAKFSIPFTVATAAARRKVVIKDFLPEGIKDPDSLKMAQKVVPKYDPAFNTIKGRPPGEIEIRTKQGKAYKKRLEVPYGHHTNPLGQDDIVKKFRDCALYSVKPLSPETVDRVIELTDRLETLDDVAEVIRLLG
jgi:2-methylcitrate dehydratase PrpD